MPDVAERTPAPRDRDALSEPEDQLAARVLSRPACDPMCEQHPEHIYVICYGQPTLTSYTERDWHPADEARNYPITHYVGWTRQHPPVRRVRQHGAQSAHHIATIVPGSRYEELVTKLFGTCPVCGGSLDYYAESPYRSSDTHG